MTLFFSFLVSAQPQIEQQVGQKTRQSLATSTEVLRIWMNDLVRQGFLRAEDSTSKWVPASKDQKIRNLIDSSNALLMSQVIQSVLGQPLYLKSPWTTLFCRDRGAVVWELDQSGAFAPERLWATGAAIGNLQKTAQLGLSRCGSQGETKKK